MTYYFVPNYVGSAPITQPGTSTDAKKGDGQGRGLGYSSNFRAEISDGWGDGMGYGVGDGDGYRGGADIPVFEESALS